MKATSQAIRAAIFVFFLAFLCEAWVGISIILSQSLPVVGYVLLLGVLCANLTTLAGCIRRRRWAFGSLDFIAALTLFWWPLGKPVLVPLGLRSFAVVAVVIFLRFGALSIIRSSSSQAWIQSNTTGKTFWLSRQPAIVLGLREKLLQVAAAILLAPAIIGYAAGWNKAITLPCGIAGVFLVVQSLRLARKREL
jgi:hypothetical protein